MHVSLQKPPGASAEVDEGAVVPRELRSSPGTQVVPLRTCGGRAGSVPSSVGFKSLCCSLSESYSSNRVAYSHVEWRKGTKSYLAVVSDGSSYLD